MLLHSSFEEFPIPASSGIFVVGECDIGSYEDVVLDRDSGRDEYEGADLTVVAYNDILFDIDERVDLRVLSDLASEQVYLIVDPCALG